MESYKYKYTFQIQLQIQIHIVTDPGVSASTMECKNTNTKKGLVFLLYQTFKLDRRIIYERLNRHDKPNIIFHTCAKYWSQSASIVALKSLKTEEAEVDPWSDCH